MSAINVYHLLVIEDNPGDYALVEDFLTEQADLFILSQARSFKAAQEMLLSGKFKFDVILLDLSLPDKKGLSLINGIVAMSLGIPVIVLTGYPDITFSIKSLSAGISDYILKDELTATILYKSIIYSAERKKATLALEESEKKYSELFQLSPLPMWVINLDTLQFMDVNNATVEHYGYSREELLSMTLKDVKPPADMQEMEINPDENEQKQLCHIQFLEVHTRKDGSLMTLELQIAPILYKGVQSNLVIATDVTERLNYIKAVERQNEKLREISWIQSHVVRAPLSRIMGLIPLIDAAGTSDSDVAEMLKYLILSANELDEVIKDITAKTLITEDPVNCPSIDFVMIKQANG
jgi:PAS domain S-box-containing protein